MRPRLRLAWWWAPILLFVGLVAGGLLAPDAHAEPAKAINAAAVCAVLETRPTADGVTKIIAELVKEAGIGPDVAFRGVSVAVAVQCPSLLPALSAFIDRYSAPPEFARGYIA